MTSTTPLLAIKPTLSVRGIEKSFANGQSRVAVLRGLHVDFFPGDMTLVAGPSGCGKSTLLSVISGLQLPDRGVVCALGTEIQNLSASALTRFRLKHTGFVFQGFNLFAALTAWEQVALPLHYMDVPKQDAKKRALEALDEVGMSRWSDARPQHMSGGQKQRVSIARALVKAPTLLFVDEPTSALDAENGQIVTQLLKRIAHERGATVVCVSHDPRMIRHADRVIHLEDGEIYKDTRCVSPPSSIQL